MHSKKSFYVLFVFILITLIVPQGLLWADEQIAIGDRGSNTNVEIAISEKGNYVYVAWLGGEVDRNRTDIRIQRLKYRPRQRKMKKKGKSVLFYSVNTKKLDNKDNKYISGMSMGRIMPDIWKGYLAWLEGGSSGGSYYLFNQTYTKKGQPIGNKQQVARSKKETNFYGIEVSPFGDPGAHVVQFTTSSGDIGLLKKTGLFGFVDDVNAPIGRPIQLISGTRGFMLDTPRNLVGYTNALTTVQDPNGGEKVIVGTYNERQYDEEGEKGYKGGYQTVDVNNGKPRLVNSGFFSDDFSYTTSVSPLGDNKACYVVQDTRTGQFSIKVVANNDPPTFYTPDTMFDVNDVNEVSGATTLGVDPYAQDPSPYTEAKASAQTGGYLLGYDKGRGTFYVQEYDKSANALGGTIESKFVSTTILSFKAIYKDGNIFIAYIDGTRSTDNTVSIYRMDLTQYN